MARWKYTLNSGSALREAIDNEDTEQVVKCLLLCYKELLDKLTGEDRKCFMWDVEDTISILEAYVPTDPDDDEDNINYYLADFYDLCDELRAWIGL